MKEKIESIIKEATELKGVDGPTAGRYSFVVAHLEAALKMLVEIERQNKISEIRNPVRPFPDTPPPFIEKTKEFAESREEKLQMLMKKNVVEKKNITQTQPSLHLNLNKLKNNKP